MWILSVPVGTAKGYGLDGQGIAVRLPAGERDFLSFTPSSLGLRATQWTMRVLLPGVKWAGNETD
jgi:hypothetical protein